MMNLYSNLDPENPDVQAFVKRVIHSDRLMKRDQKRWSVENELREAGFGTHPPENLQSKGESETETPAADTTPVESEPKD